MGSNTKGCGIGEPVRVPNLIIGIMTCNLVEDNLNFFEVTDG